MKKLRQKLLALLLLLSSAPVFGQDFWTGAILDPVRYEQTDAKPVLLARNYTNLPRSFSLKQYSPIPENQGQFGTCVAWSTAFAARTISESVALNRTNQAQSSNNVFSPAYIYLRSSNDPTLQMGMYIGDALEYMKNTGAVRRSSEERSLGIGNYMFINISAYMNAQHYPISGYVRLFSNPRGVPGTINERVLPVKKSISEGKPVIIGMNTPPSFKNRNMQVWQPTENPRLNYGGHAMCVVGYNDDMHGGAFEIQNSWGTDWGNNGYIWIRYQDFANFVYHAFEIIENLTLFRETTQYAASIQIEVYNDPEGMPVTFDRQGFYRTRMSYPSGTEFRFLMTNRYPAYVYAFAADNSTPGTTRIFPPHGISPVLDYSDSTIAWPDEYAWIQMDDVAGTDYLVVLYSKEALDIEAIERRFAHESGTFPERVSRSVGTNFIHYSNAQYNTDRIEFSAFSINPRAVFALLLAIDHH